MFRAKLKFALMGAGYIGKRYITALTRHQQCELVAVIDTNGDRFSECNNLNIPFFSSTENFFNSGIESDAVIIATPNGTHASIAIQSLKKQKHVLIEKPMALKTSDAATIIQTAKEENKKAMVVLQNRFSPVSVWLKQLIDSKQLGKIFFVEVNCFWNRDERYYQTGSWHGTKEMDGGTLFTQFSHFIDTIYWLFGNLKNIRSRFQNFNHHNLTELEDTGSIQFQLEQVGMGCLNFSTAVWDKSFESNLTIIAENGSVKISGQYMNRIEHCHIKNYSLPAGIDQTDLPVDNHNKMIDAFIEAIRQNGSTNAGEALHSIDIIERMYNNVEA